MRWRSSRSPLSCGCHRSVCLANVCRNHGTIAKDCRRVSWCRWFISLPQTVVHFGTAPVTHFAMFSFFWTGGVTSTLHKLRFKQATLRDDAQRFHGDQICNLQHTRGFPCLRRVDLVDLSQRVCRDEISWFFPRCHRRNATSHNQVRVGSFASSFRRHGGQPTS